MASFDHIASAKRTFDIETQAVTGLLARLDESFARACDLFLACKGRIIVIGVGKSGHIGSKIAATLASTGTPAYFIHPAEAAHGDFGMITADDAILAISNSGNSPEVIAILPMIKRLGIPLVSLTGQQTSTLASSADVNLNIAVEQEACPHNLAPTSSTTATLVMGDAIAIALLEAKGFSKEDFAFSHPGGTLGKKLLLRVHDVMHHGTEIPKVQCDSSLLEALQEISAKELGMTTIVDKGDKLLGIFTDGDLRRCIGANVDLQSAAIEDVMTRNPKRIADQAMAAEALNIMETSKITSLIVENLDKEIIGVLHMHDLLKAGLV